MNFSQKIMFLILLHCTHANFGMNQNPENLTAEQLHAANEIQTRITAIKEMAPCLDAKNPDHKKLATDYMDALAEHEAIIEIYFPAKEVLGATKSRLQTRNGFLMLELAAIKDQMNALQKSSAR